jgi:hypothetical protein
LKKIININKHNIKAEEPKMKNKDLSKKYSGKWMLLDKHHKVIFSSERIADVVEEGRKYKLNEVYIEKKLIPGSCFF